MAQTVEYGPSLTGADKQEDTRRKALLPGTESSALCLRVVQPFRKCAAHRRPSHSGSAGNQRESRDVPRPKQ